MTDHAARQRLLNRLNMAEKHLQEAKNDVAMWVQEIHAINKELLKMTGEE